MIRRSSDGALPDGVDERVLSVVRDGIASGRFSAGSRIPTEREFSATLEISRSAVRRSLAYLETQGRVTRHVGRGTFVAGAVSSEETPLGLSTSPVEIMDVRLMLEPQVAALAAASATTAELEKLRACLAASEKTASYEEFERYDGLFHRSIAVATHNEFLLRIVNVVNAARDEPLWGNLKRRSFTPERRRDYERDHRRLAEALEQRDGELARRVMREHIVRVRANLLEPPDEHPA